MEVAWKFSEMGYVFWDYINIYVKNIYNLVI
jgi:hypothetical protein